MAFGELNHLTDGLRKLKNGALFALIAMVLFIASKFFSINVWIGFMWWPYHSIALPLGLSLIVVVFALAFAIIALALWFAAIGNFKRYSKRYAVGKVGLILQVVALTLLAVGSLLYFNLRITAPPSPLMIISAGGAIAMLFIGIIFGIVGSI
ncbi:MAG: hypothetical protein DRJ60_02240, partial [Thermoprotei archaeon]